MNKQTLLKAMEFSALAYAQVQPPLFGELVAVIDDCPTGVQCFVRQRGSALSIVFRGSDSRKDWITDLTFFKKAIPYDNPASKIRVHGGFINAYKAPQIRGRLQRLISPQIRKVMICGHSYGAALAVLCAVDLQYNFPSKDYEVILFGCPRVGNRAFQRSYNQRVFKTLRVENGNDIVTKIPLALWGFRHVGIPVRIGAPRCFGLVSIGHHRPQSYYASLLARLQP